MKRSQGILLSERTIQAGSYRLMDAQERERWVTLNRSAEEDESEVVRAEELASLWEGVPFLPVDDRAGVASSLAKEIWKGFLVAMILMLLVEARLTMPKPVLSREGNECVNSLEDPPMIWDLTPWSLLLAVATLMTAAIMGSMAWHRSQYAWRMGVLELLRFGMIAMAVVTLLQPEVVDGGRATTGE